MICCFLHVLWHLERLKLLRFSKLSMLIIRSGTSFQNLLEHLLFLRSLCMQFLMIIFITIKYTESTAITEMPIWLNERMLAHPLWHSGIIFSLYVASDVFMHFGFDGIAWLLFCVCPLFEMYCLKEMWLQGNVLLWIVWNIFKNALIIQELSASYRLLR